MGTYVSNHHLHFQEPIDILQRFLLGGDPKECFIGGAWWDKITSRDLEVYDAGKKLGGPLGRGLRSRVDIEKFGELALYGGQLVPAEESHTCPSTHLKSTDLVKGRGMLVNGIDAGTLPTTHMGAIVNSSSTPNAHWRFVRSNTMPRAWRDHLPPLVVLRAGSAGYLLTCLRTYLVTYSLT